MIQLQKKWLIYYLDHCTTCDRFTSHCSIGVDINYVENDVNARMEYVPETLQSTVNATIEAVEDIASIRK